MCCLIKPRIKERKIIFEMDFLKYPAVYILPKVFQYK